MSARGWWSVSMASAALIVAGLLWGSLLAGVPYQDATSEQTARHAWHATFAFGLMIGGSVSLAVSIVGLVRDWWRRRVSASREAAR